MALDATARRRWFGGLVLLAALAMLVCGDTVLKDKMGLLAFFSYWLVCFALTGVAVLVAFRDLRAVLRGTRKEQTRRPSQAKPAATAAPSRGRLYIVIARVLQV